MPGGGEPVEIDHLDAVEELEDEQLAGGVLGMDARHAHGGIVCQRRANAVGRAGFALEVELERDELRDLVEDAADVEAAHEPACEPRDDPQRAEIHAREARDLRVLHLYSHGRTVAQHGAVHLRERCRGQRRLVDLREYGVERAAELVLDPTPHLVERTRRDGVVEAAEAADERRREHVGARADDLAELHEEAGQVDAQVVQAARRTIVDALPCRGRRGPAEPFAEHEEPVGQDGGDRDQTDAEDAIDGESAQHESVSLRSMVPAGEGRGSIQARRRLNLDRVPEYRGRGRCTPRPNRPTKRSSRPGRWGTRPRSRPSFAAGRSPSAGI